MKRLKLSRNEIVTTLPNVVFDKDNVMAKHGFIETRPVLYHLSGGVVIKNEEFNSFVEDELK